MTASPCVGVTWTHDLLSRSANDGENALRYLALLTGAGLVPVLLTPGTSTALVARLDGLLLPGGPDIAPARYGRDPEPGLEEVVDELDTLELDFTAAACARRLPILGICRGQQMLNVALGGTLHQHIDHPRWPDGGAAEPMHDVQVRDGTYLHRTLGVDVLAVNSGHHQAIDRLADRLVVAAVSGDQHVEAVEAPDIGVLGVQWHPEEMPGTPATRALAAGFAEWVRG